MQVLFIVVYEDVVFHFLYICFCICLPAALYVRILNDAQVLFMVFNLGSSFCILYLCRCSVLQVSGVVVWFIVSYCTPCWLFVQVVTFQLHMFSLKWIFYCLKWSLSFWHRF